MALGPKTKGRALVLGAGISGLAAARELQECGYETNGVAARIRVKNSRRCRLGVLQDFPTLLRL